jgi:hypothetical protein
MASLVRCELEHEVVREPGEVALDRLNEGACLDAVHRGEAGVEQHALPAEKDDGAFYVSDTNEALAHVVVFGADCCGFLTPPGRTARI